MALTPKNEPVKTVIKNEAKDEAKDDAYTSKAEDKADDAHVNKAEAKVAEAKEDRPTGYAAVNGSMKVTQLLETDKNGAPNGTMLYPITEATGPAGVGYSWSGEKYYPPAL